LDDRTPATILCAKLIDDMSQLIEAIARADARAIRAANDRRLALGHVVGNVATYGSSIVRTGQIPDKFT
jgi:hypothetical protein